MADGLSPFRYSKFRRVWIGQLANITGDGVYPVAIALYLLPRHEAARALGTVLAATSIGAIVSLLVAGALADRHRRSIVMIGSDGARAAGIVGIILVGANGPLPGLAAFGFILGVGVGLYRPASAALLPSLVPRDAIPRANAIRELTNSVAGIAGGALGGLVVVATSAPTALWLDVATFLVSTITLLGVHEPRPAPALAKNSILKDMSLGFTYVIKRPWMASVMIQGTIYVAFVTSPITVMLPIFLGVEHKVWYGFIVAADAAGAFLGISIGSAIKSKTPGRVAMLAALLPIPQLLCLAFNLPLWLLLASSVLAGVGLAMFGIIWTTALQTKVNSEILGRVFAFDAFSSTGLAPVGLAVAGWAISYAGTSDVALGAIAILVVSVLVPLLAVPGVASFADNHPDDRGPG
jgi:MFS family permease